MKFLRLIIASLCVGVLLTSVGECYASTVTAQDKEQATKTDVSETATTATGFPTGTKCTKTGVYRAGNKYLDVILVVAEGEEFPAFVDGEKTIWYVLTPKAKSSFDSVKVTTGSN